MTQIVFCIASLTAIENRSTRKTNFITLEQNKTFFINFVDIFLSAVQIILEPVLRSNNLHFWWVSTSSPWRPNYWKWRKILNWVSHWSEVKSFWDLRAWLMALSVFIWAAFNGFFFKIVTDSQSDIFSDALCRFSFGKVKLYSCRFQFLRIFYFVISERSFAFSGKIFLRIECSLKN